jgi:hypothetical protein
MRALDCSVEEPTLLLEPTPASSIEPRLHRVCLPLVTGDCTGDKPWPLEAKNVQHAEWPDPSPALTVHELSHQVCRGTIWQTMHISFGLSRRGCCLAQGNRWAWEELNSEGWKGAECGRG